MKIRVRDIEALWKNRFAALVAGRGGLDRIVEFYDMMEQPDIKPWLRENLLVITTGYAIRNDKKALLNLIRDLREVNASALAIKTRFFDEFPREALELADECEIPLFFLNNDVGFIEVVYPVMTAIVEARNQLEMSSRYQMGTYSQMEMNGKLFLDLQTGKITQAEEAEQRVNSLNWPFPPLRMILIQAKQNPRMAAAQEKDMESIYQMMKGAMEQAGIWGAGIVRQYQYVCIMKDAEAEKAGSLCSMMVEKICDMLKYRVVAGISRQFYDYMELGDVYKDVKDVFYIREKKGLPESVLWAEKLRYELIMMHMAQQQEVRAFVQEKLAALEIYDREHESHLTETLEMLSSCRGSRKLAAEKLYLHRNTMFYRLHQIEQVLGCDLSDAGQLDELGFACRMKEYM